MITEKKNQIETVVYSMDPAVETSSAMNPGENRNQLSSDQSLDKAMPSISDEYLDQLLSDLARDVPPLPESFRRNWRQAIHQEADAVREDNKENDSKPDTVFQKENISAPQKAAPPISSSGAALQEGDPTVLDSDNVIRIRSGKRSEQRYHRFLTIAAMALFLLGGTLLARPSLFLFPRKVASLTYNYSPVSSVSSTSTPHELAAYKTTGEEKAASIAAEKEEAAFEAVRKEATTNNTPSEEDEISVSISEAVVSFDAALQIQAGGRIESSGSGADSPDKAVDQRSVLSESVSVNSEDSGTVSDFIFEEEPVTPDSDDAEQDSQKAEVFSSQAVESEPSAKHFPTHLQFLGMILVVTALLLFILRRRI